MSWRSDDDLREIAKAIDHDFRFGTARARAIVRAVFDAETKITTERERRRSLRELVRDYEP